MYNKNLIYQNVGGMDTAENSHICMPIRKEIKLNSVS